MSELDETLLSTLPSDVREALIESGMVEEEVVVQTVTPSLPAMRINLNMEDIDEAIEILSSEVGNGDVEFEEVPTEESITPIIEAVPSIVRDMTPVPNQENETMEDDIPISEQFERFKDANWFEGMQNIECVIAGVGGIGGWTSLFLSRTGCKLILIDPDRFETVNMAGQCMRFQDKGTPKAHAVRNICVEFSDNHRISTYSVRLSSTPEFGHYGNTITTLKHYVSYKMTRIFICGFDNMEARRTFFNMWNELITSGDVNPEKTLFIDARLAAELWQLITIKGNDAEAKRIYEKDYLFTDEEATQEVCSFKQTTHVATSLASRIVSHVVNFISNENSELPRPVPFYVEFDAVTLNTETIL